MFQLPVLVFVVLFSGLCKAEFEVYKSTDNTGINKYERIGVIETYLTNLSTALNKMEAKIDANYLKLSTLEGLLKANEAEVKKMQASMGEKKAPTASEAELEKLKADFLAIKNEDIEKLKIQVQGLNYSIQSVQGLLEMKKK